MSVTLPYKSAVYLLGGHYYVTSASPHCVWWVILNNVFVDKVINSVSVCSVVSVTSFLEPIPIPWPNVIKMTSTSVNCSTGSGHRVFPISVCLTHAPTQHLPWIQSLTTTKMHSGHQCILLTNLIDVTFIQKCFNPNHFNSIRHNIHLKFLYHLLFCFWQGHIGAENVQVLNFLFYF